MLNFCGFPTKFQLLLPAAKKQTNKQTHPTTEGEDQGSKIKVLLLYMPLQYCMKRS